MHREVDFKNILYRFQILRGACSLAKNSTVFLFFAMTLSYPRLLGQTTGLVRMVLFQDILEDIGPSFNII